MKQLISGIKGLTNRVRSMAQTHRPLFEGEIYLTGREVCERLFLSPRTLQDYRNKGIIPYTQIAGKILYRLSDINRILSENYRKPGWRIIFLRLMANLYCGAVRWIHSRCYTKIVFYVLSSPLLLHLAGRANTHVAIEQKSLDCSTFGFDISQCTIIGIRFPFMIRHP